MGGSREATAVTAAFDTDGEGDDEQVVFILRYPAKDEATRRRVVRALAWLIPRPDQRTASPASRGAGR